MQQTLKVKRLRDGAFLPERATEGSAGYDLRAYLDEPLVIPPDARMKVPTGISIALPENTAGLVYARSGLALKKGIHMANDVGVVDSDYRGEILVPVHNRGNEPFTVNSGDRIAQLIVTPVITPDVKVYDELPETERGSGGFGSTGTN